MYQAAIITDPVDAELRENEMIRQVQQFLPVLAESFCVSFSDWAGERGTAVFAVTAKMP